MASPQACTTHWDVLATRRTMVGVEPISSTMSAVRQITNSESMLPLRMRCDGLRPEYHFADLGKPCAGAGTQKAPNGPRQGLGSGLAGNVGPKERRPLVAATNHGAAGGSHTPREPRSVQNPARCALGATIRSIGSA